MATLSTTHKPLSHFSPFVKQQHNPINNNNASFTCNNTTNSFLSKRGGSVTHKKRMFASGHDAPSQVESSWRIPLSEVVVVTKKKAFWERSWSSWDVSKLVVVVGVHLLGLSAPFNVDWAAFRGSLWLAAIGGMCITLSYRRNLTHRSFDLPKWLEYLFAYGGVLAFQCGGHENLKDLVRQPFYRFLHQTLLWHQRAFALILFYYGGMRFLVWGIGVATVVRNHATFLVNSVCHIWGNRAWNTPDFSKNNWWVAILTFGEGWHNNHHAFESSARHRLEWWQLDVSWYLIMFLEAIGLATKVKLPTKSQKKKMSLALSSSLLSY